MKLQISTKCIIFFKKELKLVHSKYDYFFCISSVLRIKRTSLTMSGFP